MLSKKELLSVISRDLVKAGAATLAAAGAVLFFSVKIAEISGSIAEKKETQAQLEQRNETRAGLKNDVARAQQARTAIERAMPPQDNVMDFVAALENIARQNSLAQTLKFETPVAQTDEAFSSIDFTVELNANIFTLASYLKKFEQLPYAAGITGIDLRALTDKGWENNSAVIIRGKLYARANGGGLQ